MLLLAPATAWAGHPLKVEDTATEGKGNYLFEITGDYAKNTAFKSTLLTGIITAGTGRHTDLSLEAPYLMLNPGPLPNQNESGAGDVRIKLKHRLFENEVKQSMAFQLYADAPTGDGGKGLGTDHLVWGVLLSDTQECRNKVLHLNAGYEAFGSDMKRWHFASNYAIKFGFAVEHKLAGSLRLVTELAGESRKEAERYSRPLNLLGGVIYDISRSWYVDLGARAGLNKYADDYVVLVGTAWRF
jgi:hypothetical protein